MKTEISSMENKNKFNKINKKIKTLQPKSIHSNSFKQRNNFSNSSNKYNNVNIINNTSLLNSQKKSGMIGNKFSNLNQNKFQITKKLNIIKEAKENPRRNTNNNNTMKKNFIPRNNNKQLIMDKNKSYVCDDKKKAKKDDEVYVLKKLTIQDENKIKEKFSSNLKFRACKSSIINGLIGDNKRKEKDKEQSKNNQVINVNKNANLNSKFKKMLNNKKNNNINLDDDIFFYDESKPITLTQDELIIYGDRNMKGYNKIKILGKGGYGVVWLAQKHGHHEISGYAVKQTSKKNGPAHNKEDVLQIAKNEIDILIKLNNNENKCDLIPRIYETYEDNNDIWFSFEKGGLSLSTLTFNIKGIFEKGERLYHIQKGEILLLLFKNINQFKLLIKKILEGIDYINKNGIIHSDIKPENILVQYTTNNNVLDISSIKIVDYGSAFYTSNTSPLISNTPEYLCPEIMTNNKEFIKELNKGNYANSIDIWSLGISILELCLCCPIWMSYKTKICINGKITNNMGYFGCKGRDGNKIYQRQIELSHNLNKILKNSMIYMFDDKNKNLFIDLLSKMLTFDYTKRITTEKALKHPFLANL